MGGIGSRGCRIRPGGEVLVRNCMYVWSWSWSFVGDKTYREEAEADGPDELAGGYCGRHCWGGAVAPMLSERSVCRIQ